MPEILGAAELAERWKISKQLLGLWRVRGKCPPPDYELKMGPVWLVSTIEAWDAEHR